MTTQSNNGLTATFSDAWLLDGVRTPFVDYNGALAAISPIDLGIKAAREVFAQSGAVARRRRHRHHRQHGAGELRRLHAAAPYRALLPACRSRRRRIMVQRVCGTGIEVLTQAADTVIARPRRSGALRRHRIA